MTILPTVVFDGVIDVSHHNGAIDWPSVAEAGIALAFIKATQGASFLDPRFGVNMAGARAAGIIAVPYHFLDAAPAAAQAQHFIAAAALEADSPSMLDWEGPPPPPSDRLADMGRLIEDRTGRPPICYYGGYELPPAAAAPWPLMLPAYPGGDRVGDYASLVTRAPHLPPRRPASRPYDFHQYTATGRVPGITGNVDRSIWVGTRASLLAYFGPQVNLGEMQPPLSESQPPAESVALTAGDLYLAARRFQQIARSLGQYDGKIDGWLGPKSEAASLWARERRAPSRP